MQQKSVRNLDEKGFRQYCNKRKLGEKTIQQHLDIVKEFESYLKTKEEDLDRATIRDTQAFVSQLMKDGKNTEDNLVALARYANFTNNRKVVVSLLELIDGSEVLQYLSDELEKRIGKIKRDEIFEGVELPPLGTRSKDKPRLTQKVMKNLEAKLDDEKCMEILTAVHHGPIPKEVFMPERKKFLESKNIDDFLKKRHREYVNELEQHMKNKTLYFTQEINKEVLDYVRQNPTCQNGVRKGDIIHVTKIPYMAKKYLREKDPKKKRYFACHCPWVREAIKTGDQISPNFCYCSAGFEKQPWDVIFDKPVRADVVESVLKGDLVCKFAIHIPHEFLNA